MNPSRSLLTHSPTTSTTNTTITAARRSVTAAQSAVLTTLISPMVVVRPLLTDLTLTADLLLTWNSKERPNTPKTTQLTRLQSTRLLPPTKLPLLMLQLLMLHLPTLPSPPTRPQSTNLTLLPNTKKSMLKWKSVNPFSYCSDKKAQNELKSLYFPLNEQYKSFLS